MIKHIGGIKFRTLEEGDHPKDFISTYGNSISACSDPSNPGLNQYEAAYNDANKLRGDPSKPV